MATGVPAKLPDDTPDNVYRNTRSWYFSVALFLGTYGALLASHASLLRLPYFWDEAGYYVPAARDLLSGALIPYSTPSNAHPPLVMMSLALAWKFFGEATLVTRCIMLLWASLALTGFHGLARRISNTTVAACATALVAIYPVFFAQSSLAQVDLPAAGLTFWGLEAYFRLRHARSALWFALAALAKETAILVPLGLCVWEFWKFCRALPRRPLQRIPKEVAYPLLALFLCTLPLGTWYLYHYSRTGFAFGNPEFLHYNLQGNLTPVRVVLALLLRVWQTTGYLNLYVLTLASVVAMMYPPQFAGTPANHHQEITDGGSTALRPRIAIPIQLALLSAAIVYLLSMSVLGGAVLARYLLPIVPLMILISVSTIWRRLRFWRTVLAVVGVSFVLALVFNPPYGFAPEDNLAYADYIHMHQRAGAFVESHYPHARVLTAWPASDELSRPYLGYVRSPVKVVRIEDFTTEQLMSAADAKSQFDVALVFSTKYRAPHSVFDRLEFWQQWKIRYFGYHIDLTPEAAAAMLGGTLVYTERHAGQWVGVIRLEKKDIEEARLRQHD